MKFIMTVSGEKLELDTDHMMMREADKLEKFCGWTVNQWVDGLLENRVNAVRFAYWLAKERAGEPVETPFAEIDLDLGDIKWDVDLPEGVDVEPEDDDENPTGSPQEGESA